MKLIIAFLLSTSVVHLAHAKAEKTRTVASISEKKCKSVAKDEAKRVLQLEGVNGEGTGVIEDIPIKFLRLNNGGVYVVPGFIQKTFTWEVVVVVDGNCAIQGSILN